MKKFAISAIFAIAVLFAQPSQAQSELHLGAYPYISETPMPEFAHRRHYLLNRHVLVDFSSQSNLYRYTHEWNIRHEKILLAILEELKQR